MEAMLIINAALIVISGLLASLALYSTNRLRLTVIESIKGGNENAGSVRSVLVETKKAIANLDVQVETINTKVSEHERALVALRSTIEEVRNTVRPSTAASSAGGRASS